MTTPTRRTRRLVGVGAALGLAAVSMIGATSATADGHLNEVVFSGQGLDDDGNIEEVICNEDNDPYLLWVLAGTKADNASVNSVGIMTKSGNGNGGAFKITTPIAAGADLTSLIGVVTAVYDGPERNAQFVISHGCPGDDQPPS